MRAPVFCNLLLQSLLLLSLQIGAASFALAESRVALVIGQSAYRAVPALPNAGNDGKGMTELLGRAGFDVTTASDLTQADMRRSISDFATKVAASGPDTVALVFYAGHGLQIDGENYLVPVDVDPKREADIPLQAVRLNDLMNTLGELPTRMRIFMLDACRNNPFPALRQTTGHGLAVVNTKAGAPGSFISFSTSPGAEAEDGAGAHSPYTTAVLAVVTEPNLPIEQALKRVRVAVNQATGGRQVPWESSSLTDDFKFFAGAPDSNHNVATPRPPSAPPRSVDDWRRNLAGKDPKTAYDMVIADDTVVAYEAFTGLFAQSSYNAQVHALLERRREMLAWETAVATDTAASFEAFLAEHANSDLAATARKMRERVRNRSLAASAPTNVALGPTCPCSTPSPPVIKKVEPAPRTRQVERTSPKRKRQPVRDVDDRRPPPAYVPPDNVGGYGGGYGGGYVGFGGHGGGGGGGRR